jgi:hypothetical protein
MTTSSVKPICTANDEPPSLNYDLRARTKSNVIFWSTLVFTVTIIPITVYYPLVNLSMLKIDAILGISSISQGLPNIIQLPYRFWQLWKQDGGDRRPLNGRILDFFMYEYILSFLLIATCYIVSTSIPIP